MFIAPSLFGYSQIVPPPDGCGCPQGKILVCSVEYCNTEGSDLSNCCINDPNPTIPLNSNLPWLISAGGILIGLLFFVERQARKRVQ